MKFSDRLTTQIVLFRLLNCNRTNRSVIYVAKIDVNLLRFHKLKTKFGKFEHKIHKKNCTLNKAFFGFLLRFCFKVIKVSKSIKVNIYLAFVQL